MNRQNKDDTAGAVNIPWRCLPSGELEEKPGKVPLGSQELDPGDRGKKRGQGIGKDQQGAQRLFIWKIRAHDQKGQESSRNHAEGRSNARNPDRVEKGAVISGISEDLTVAFQRKGAGIEKAPEKNLPEWIEKQTQEKP